MSISLSFGQPHFASNKSVITKTGKNRSNTENGIKEAKEAFLRNKRSYDLQEEINDTRLRLSREKQKLQKEKEKKNQKLNRY